MQQTRTATIDMQITMMINGTTTEHLLTPHESLQKRLAVYHRKSHKGMMKLDALWKAPELSTWNQSVCSSLLFVCGTATFRDEIDCGAALMTDFLFREANVPIMWALKGTRLESTECSSTDLFKYLVSQAMRFDPVATGHQVSGSFNASRVVSASTEQDWMEVLSIVLSSFSIAYIIVDIEFLGASGRDREGLQLLLRNIQGFVCQKGTTAVKIAVLTYRKAALTNAMTSLPNLQQTYLVHLGRLASSVTTVNPRVGRRAKEQLAFKKGFAMHRRSLQFL